MTAKCQRGRHGAGFLGPCRQSHPSQTALRLVPWLRGRVGKQAARILLGVFIAAWTVPPVGGFADDVSFNRDIRPILSENCFQCHGPDAASRQADLRLDQRQAAVEYFAIVPGKPDESALIDRITSDDPDLMMPPPSSNRSLTAGQKDLLRRWVAAGAEYQSHWAFNPPSTPPIPAVDNAQWPQNPIDHFILHRLEQEGLHPTPRAGRERLIRRLTFDLTGLPPTLDEIDAFLADGSPNAYERLVDRLLGSPRYGERMASEWLDVARYGDSYGYQVDRDRFVWPWRDWVIRVFNKNMPYDEFITLQLAGDLLPNATDAQILATTFNRLHSQKVEGGSVPEEFRVEYVADRAQTVATAFLGLTLECARCHDHKYDPITQKEYYQLTAFFDNIDEAGLYSYFTESVPTPTLLLADAATKARLAELDERITRAEMQLAAVSGDRLAEFEKWLAGPRRRPASPSEAESAAEVTHDAASNSEAPHDLIPGRIAHLDFEKTQTGPNQTLAGRIGNAIRLTGDDGIELEIGNFRRFEPFSVSLWMNTPDEKQRAVVFHRSRAWTDAGSRGYQLLIEDGRLSASLIHFWPGNAMRIKTRDKIPVGQWLHVTMTYDGSSRADGLQIFVNGAPAPCTVVRDNLFKNITGGGGDHITIGQRFRDRGFTDGLVDEFQVFKRRLTPMEAAHLHDGTSLTDALETPLGKLTPQQRDGLFAYYLETLDAAYCEQRAALTRVREQRCRLMNGVQEIMVMREMPEPRPTYLLKRGAYDARGEQVFPETPAVFSPFPPDAPRNRLGLARWLTQPNHALTPRVAVNRYWQMLFGNGLVRTPEDFGSQGQPPTHPQLLDWLARDFVRSGWNVKRLLKTIVTSATYQQDSRISRELLARDPENRLLARAPSFRLTAEMLRDNALAVSGLLVPTIGGPPAKPYEVEQSFKPAKRDEGAGLYRRSLYTYWRRTAPAPVMTTLDAPGREVCRVQRERTSSPLQALVLFNGPQFVEAARVLSQRVIQRHGDDQSRVFAELFRTLTSRRPTGAEMDILRRLYEQQLATFQKHPERAKKYLDVGEAHYDETLDAAKLAATAVVANTLMTFDECVIRR